MSLVLNEEQRSLKDSARSFLQDNASIELARTLRDDTHNDGYSSDVWQKMVELGWPAITIAEEYEGLGFGYNGLGLIFEELGHGLSGSPLLSNVVLGASLIELHGTQAQKQTLLPSIADGSVRYALAYNEKNYHQPNYVACSASADGEHFIINGTKTAVLHGDSADKLIIVARTSGDTDSQDGLSLFIIDRNNPAISGAQQKLLDGSTLNTLTFTDLNISQEQLLGEKDNAWSSLNDALNRACISLSAEMLGGCLQTFQRTMEYLKEREQFDVKIGSFQALKHRASQMFIQLELCKSVILKGLNSIDNGEDVSELASLAKSMLNDAYILITDEATQMHGGIGVTDELDIGLFLKRARVCTQLFGNSDFHKARYAALKSY